MSRSARAAPFVVSGLFALRVVGCDPSRDAPGSADTTDASTLGTCDVNGVITYGNGKKHVCSRGCVSSLARVACVPDYGIMPFRVCSTAADCIGASYCSSPGVKTDLLDARCVNNVCDWQTQSAATCATAACCQGTMVSGTGGNWTTSGGFPWNPGTGGGVGGTTSGGFPWNPGTGGAPNSGGVPTDAGVHSRSNDAGGDGAADAGRG
jgi:hypothetical protein